MAPQIDTAAHLGVQHDRARLCRVGGGIDIGVTDAFEMGDDRDAAFALHPLDQRAPTARHDHIDMITHPEHQPDRGAVTGRHQLYRGIGQTRRAQPLAQRRDQSARRIKTLRAAAQDRGISRFERQPAGIGGHIWPALVDDADNAERHRDALDVEPVRPRPAGERAADRVGQFGDRFEPGGDRFDALRIERQAVAQCRGEPLALRLGEVAGVGGEDFRRIRPHRGSGCQQRPLLNLGRGERQCCGGSPRLTADLGHFLGQTCLRDLRAVAQ